MNTSISEIKTVRAAFVIIGNEILSGRTKDVNLSYLAAALVQVGIPAARGAKIAGTIAEKTIKAIKTGKRVSLKNKNISKAARIANKTGRGAVVASGSKDFETFSRVDPSSPP